MPLKLSQLDCAGDDVSEMTERLLGAIADRRGPVIAVSNEIGMGLVPETKLGRKFRDAQGKLNQNCAARASSVAFVAAGLPLWLKGGP